MFYSESLTERDILLPFVFDCKEIVTCRVERGKLGRLIRACLPWVELLMH